LSHDAQNITPSTFVAEWVPFAGSLFRERKRALDIAMGRGRHTLELTHAGFKTFGVDVKLEAVRQAVARASRHGSRIHAWCADLTRHPLPRARFELVLVTRYLQRDLFGSISDALVPGGVVIYETFTVSQRTLGTGPTAPEHLLDPGELRLRFPACETIFYEEVVASEAVARLVARK
jgi:tellurite methyltransferase